MSLIRWVDLLVHMLDVNPETRYTIQQVMAHDYFTAVNVFDYPALLSSAPAQDVEDPMVRCVTSCVFACMHVCV